MTRLLAALVIVLSPLALLRQTQQKSQNFQNSRLGEEVAGDAVVFKTPEGRMGWKVVIAAGKPLATPAVVDGKVFVGGGFGSHYFYAFDAVTGKKLWQYRTKDDGPTAAVVAEGHVVFNTESCELEVLTVEGKPVWKKWLGDPLMSMPAVADGRVYMAFPDSKGDRHHYLACFDLKSGKEHWRKPIPGEIITAPVIANGQVFLATLEGTLSCFTANGTPVWQEKKNATSAPLIWDNRAYFSRREETVVTSKDGRQTAQQNEAMACKPVEGDSPARSMVQTRREADYLDYGKRGKSQLESSYQSQDANVGFGSAKGDAKIGQALRNLGQNTVVGVWSYQGSRPFVVNGRLYGAMGDLLKCVDAEKEALLWKKDLNDRRAKGSEALLDSVLTPPAVVNGKIFVGTAQGEILCFSADRGERLWSAQIGEPIQFQPAVVGGRVFVATTTGSLLSLETGDANDDGWAMWGGCADHNRLSPKTSPLAK